VGSLATQLTQGLSARGKPTAAAAAAALNVHGAHHNHPTTD